MEEFPILERGKTNFTIPWGLIAPHEKQALKNHGQTLKRLAERGGLSFCEALAVLEDRPWRKMDNAWIDLAKLVVKYQDESLLWRKWDNDLSDKSNLLAKLQEQVSDRPKESYAEWSRKQDK